MSIISDSPTQGNGSRPQALPVLADHIPAVLRELAAWLVWRYVPDVDAETGTTDWDKPPLSVRTGRLASSTDPGTWTPFAEALAAYGRGDLDGIGLALQDWPGAGGLTLVAIDLDRCRDRDTGTVEPWAADIIRTLDSYTEVSPSGRGIRIFVWGTLPPRGRKRGPVEMYSTGRYVTVTGQRVDGTPATVEARPTELLEIHARFWPPAPAAARGSTGGGTPTDLEDAEIIRRAGNARNGVGPKFKRLWSGDKAGYGSHSEADLALCSYLAFWCGPDEERIADLFSQSGLARAKWQREDYRQRTIAKALEGRTEFYRPRKRGPAVHLNGSGQNGTGRNGSADRHQEPEPDCPPQYDDGPPPDESAGDEPQRLSAYSTILAHFRQRYQPTFRRGTSIYSAALGREVRISEACCGAGIDLIIQLAEAIDAPRDKRGVVDWSRLPYLFRDWCRSAWVDLLGSLPDEERAGEVSGDAQEDFRAQVRAALLTIIALGHTYRSGNEERVETQRRSLFDWCNLWARLGKWEGIRSYQLWARRDAGEGNVSWLRIALRVDLFTQINHAVLGKIRQGRFGKLCELYDVGTAGGEDGRVHGKRVVELSPGFIDELRGRPPDAVLPDGGPSHARARESVQQCGKTEAST